MASTARRGGQSRTGAATAVPHVQLPLSEELFSAVLQQCRPSRARVEAVTHLALRHLANAADVWTALRKALIAEADLNSTHNQAMWYVVDSLLKHATHVFQPLMAPRLLEFVIQQMPWHLVQWSASVVEATSTNGGSGGAVTTGSGAGRLMWCERLVRTWEPYLPASVFQPIRQHAVHCRSEAELGGALSVNGTHKGPAGLTSAASGHQAGATGPAASPSDPATPDQLRQLTESWQTFYYWCRALEEQQQRREAPTWLQQVLSTAATTAEAVATQNTEATAAPADPTTKTGTANGAPSAVANPPRTGSGADGSGTDEDDGDDDGEYDPEFVSGAKPRALPKLDLPRRRREARRRPRDEDDL